MSCKRHLKLNVLDVNVSLPVDELTTLPPKKDDVVAKKRESSGSACVRYHQGIHDVVYNKNHELRKVVNTVALVALGSNSHALCIRVAIAWECMLLVG